MARPHTIRVAAHRYLDAPDPIAALTEAGVDTSDGGEVREFILPHDTGVRATFQAEGTSHKVMKLFTGELQIGEPAFDDAVFITTDTKDAAKRLLDTTAFRSAVVAVVETGGHVRLNGPHVVVALGPADAMHTIVAYAAAYAELLQ